jgi:DNA-binding NarL/FixJ family response regulator
VPPLGLACLPRDDRVRWACYRAWDVGEGMAVTHQRKSEPIGNVIRRARAGQRARPQGRGEPDRPIRVAVADDSYLIRNALGEVLGQIERVELVATADDGDALLEAVGSSDPDVVIIDIRMPPTGDDEGIRVATKLREDHPGVGVIVLSQHSDARYALGLLEDGAEGRGYLLKERVHDREELASAIDIVAAGGTMIDPTVIEGLIAADRRRRDSPLDDLTPREHEVLAEMAQGKSNAAIAESLVLTKRAVEKHVGAIFQKLALEDDEVVSRRVTAVLLYLSDSTH